MSILGLFLLVAGIVVAYVCRANIVLLIIGIIIAVIGALVLFGNGVDFGDDARRALAL